MRYILPIILSTLLFAFACTTSPTADHEPAAHHSNHSNTNSAPAAGHTHDSSDPHMRMTARREPNAEDLRRAGEIAAEARRAIEKYRDHKAALRDGFEILLPDVPQNMYHFNKLENYLEAESRFDAARPTSLLYEKTTDGGYRLIGVMYTAPAGMSEAELDARVPLSVAQWHEHVNICLPKGTSIFNGLIGQGERFGLTGSIATKAGCDAAGGQFLPRLLGWMVHLYPDEPTIERMWSVERQMNPAVVGR